MPNHHVRPPLNLATRKRRVRHPLGAVARCRLGHHLVDLLKGKTLGLGHQEVGIDEAAAAQAAPDVKHLGTKVALVLVHHVGGNDGNDAVPWKTPC